MMTALRRLLRFMREALADETTTDAIYRGIIRPDDPEF